MGARSGGARICLVLQLGVPPGSLICSIGAGQSQVLPDERGGTPAPPPVLLSLSVRMWSSSGGALVFLNHRSC